MRGPYDYIMITILYLKFCFKNIPAHFMIKDMHCLRTEIFKVVYGLTDTKTCMDEKFWKF